MAITETAMMNDLSFAEYNERQLYEISAGRNRERALCAKPAGNFAYHEGTWAPQEYEGFAVVSMLNANDGNDALLARLMAIQEELRYNLQPRYGFYQLPSSSFHQTVANTLSADRFKQHILNPGLEETYPELIAGAFKAIPYANDESPLQMQMVGLSVFGTAIGMLGIFNNEGDYNRVTRFRGGFYSNEDLAALDIRMTRPFIGHITLTYVEHGLNKNQKDQLAIVVSEINESLQNESLYFNIAKTELRRYHHLAEFIKQDNYPDFKL
jgi:hypothetical protein